MTFKKLKLSYHNCYFFCIVHYAGVWITIGSMVWRCASRVSSTRTALT